eukprot:6435479-Prymnesium_polylepis.1
MPADLGQSLKPRTNSRQISRFQKSGTHPSNFRSWRLPSARSNGMKSELLARSAVAVLERD